jgi:hypothetical protein
MGVDTAVGPAMTVGYAGNSIGRSVGFFNIRPDSLASAPNPSLRFFTVNVQRLIITNTGNVGIGTSTPILNPNIPQSGLEIASPNVATLWLTGIGVQGAAIRGRNFNGTIASPTATAANDVLLAVGGLGFDGANYANANRASIHFAASQAWTSLAQGTYMTFNLTPDGSTNRAEIARFDPSGNFGIGVVPISPSDTLSYKLDVNGTGHFAGNVNVTGTLTASQVIGATYQDVAEWVDSNEKLAPGTVVVVARDAANHVMASAKAYDTRVAGVVSGKPGLILGTGGDSKSMVATTGRVRVHVDATAAPIEIGDLLVTSLKPGTAMKSVPVNMFGIEMHRPGTLIGKALEPLQAGQGDILVLLSLQ